MKTTQREKLSRSIYCVFQLLTASKTSMLVFWVVPPWGLVGRYYCFGGTSFPFSPLSTQRSLLNPFTGSSRSLIKSPSWIWLGNSPCPTLVPNLLQTIHFKTALLQPQRLRQYVPPKRHFRGEDSKHEFPEHMLNLPLLELNTGNSMIRKYLATTALNN